MVTKKSVAMAGAAWVGVRAGGALGLSGIWGGAAEVGGAFFAMYLVNKLLPGAPVAK